MWWRGREENENVTCGRVLHRGESNKTCVQYLQAIHLTALTSTSGHGSQKFFFHRTSLKWWGKKGTGVLQQELLTVFQKDSGGTPLHLAVPGLTWELVLFLTPLSYIRKRIGKEKASLHHSLFGSLSGHFPAREKRNTAPCRAQGRLPVVTLSHMNPFYQNGKSRSNNCYGHFKHILLLLAMSYHLEKIICYLHSQPTKAMPPTAYLARRSFTAPIYYT